MTRRERPAPTFQVKKTTEQNSVIEISGRPKRPLSDPLYRCQLALFLVCQA